MKAIVYRSYGSPKVLRLREVDKPEPRDDEVLVRVCATSLNAADLDQLRGTTFVRIRAPFIPKHKILGSDISGIVESTGRDVTRFRPGDEVYADLTEFGFGAFCEFVSVPERALALKPTNLTFEDAAAVPSAGGVALLNLCIKREIQPGQRVLVNGAGGGMGTFAVQIAKHYGADVTGVDIAEKLDKLLAIGADRVIDYKREDFTQNGQVYDLILDLAAHHSISDYRRALSPDGAFVFVGGSASAVLRTALAPMSSNSDSRDMGMVMAYPTVKELDALKKLIEAGAVIPIIDREYPLSDTADAFRYLEGGTVIGKIVIKTAGC